MEKWYSQAERRERVLKFCYGYFIKEIEAEPWNIPERYVEREPDLKPQERSAIIRLIEENPYIRRHYTNLFLILDVPF